MSSKTSKKKVFLLVGLIVVFLAVVACVVFYFHDQSEKSSVQTSHKAPEYANYIIGDYAGEYDITAVVTDGKTSKVATGTVKASDNRISLDDGKEKITGTYRQKGSETSYVYNDTRGRFLSLGTPEGVDWARVLTITDASGKVQKSYYLEKKDAHIEGSDEFVGTWKIDHGTANGQPFQKENLDTTTANMTLRLTDGGTILIIDDASQTAAVNHYEISDGQIKIKDDTSNMNYDMKKEGKYIVWNLSDPDGKNSAEYYMTKQ